MNMMAVIPLAAESGDQSRMDIHHSALEIIGNLNQLQETGQANQLDPMLAAKIEEASAEFVPRGKGFAVDNSRGNAGIFRADQSKCVRMVGGYQNDLGL